MAEAITILIRLHDVSNAQLQRWSREFLQANRQELMGQALGSLAWAHEVMHAEPRPGNQWVRLCRCQVRNDHRICASQH
jgi:hypothetical protein